MTQKATVIDTKEGIAGVRLCVLRGRLKLEIAGIKFRGGSAYALIKRELGFKGNREAVLAQLETHIAFYNEQHRFGGPAKAGTMIVGKVGEGRPA